MIVVPGYGRKPSEWMLIGEAPGLEESRRKRPFVGRSGEELNRLLSRHGLSLSSAYTTNVCKEHREGNPDPTREQIEYWTPTLLREIEEVNPKIIVATGRYAARWLLGEEATLDITHGIPHRGGAFDSSLAYRSRGAVILPCIHPAAGFYDSAVRPAIAWDYSQVAETLRRLRRGEPIDYREDEHAGREIYEDVTGEGLRDLIDLYDGSSLLDGPITELGLDTEGVPDNPWSIQVSFTPGQAATLRRSQPDFHIGVRALQALADRGTTFITHCASTPTACMYDILMCRTMGLNLSRASIIDTMYMLYLLRIEPRGLKAAAWRWAGMKLIPYMELIGDIGKRKQIEYLQQIVSRSWPKSEPRVVTANDGTSKLYKPSAVEKTVERILADVLAEKVNKDGEPADPLKRWRGVDEALRKMVESEIGSMPIGTLNDLPLEQAIRYAGADSDATLRIKRRLIPELERLDLTRTMQDGCDILPVFEEMQYNGMPASHSRFTDLHAYLDHEYFKTINKISRVYCAGEPFNPRSNPQTNDLLTRLGLHSTKRTSTGLQSTSKKSIEHLRYKHPAISLLFEAREYAHMRDSFCSVFLDTFLPDTEIHNVRSVFKPANTETRRLAAEDPNILNIPARTPLGRRVKACFVTKGDDEVFLVADLSQIELRVLADESCDPLLCKIFMEDRDAHWETAARLFGRPVNIAEKIKKERDFAKTINFGIGYGMSPHALFEQCRMQGLEDWDEDACERLQKEWFKIYVGVAQYKRDLVRKAVKDGYVRDRGGMYRYLPNLESRDRKERAEAERHVVSHRIQGTAQTMIQRSMGWIKRRVWELQDAGLNVVWRCQYHDELDFTGDEWLEPIVRDIVIEGLTEHCGIKLRVPVLAGWSMGRSWADAK